MHVLPAFKLVGAGSGESWVPSWPGGLLAMAVTPVHMCTHLSPSGSASLLLFVHALTAVGCCMGACVVHWQLRDGPALVAVASKSTTSGALAQGEKRT